MVLTVPRAERQWPADGVLPDDAPETLIAYVEEWIRRAVENVPGLRERGHGWQYRPPQSQVYLTHEPSHQVVQIVIEVFANVRDPYDRAMHDWQYEVANGDTRLGFDEWKQHQREAADNEE